jgi:replicative superfamily II helicase
MDFEDSEEVTPEPPMAPEKTEGYGMMYKTDKMKEMIENIFSESKVEKVLNKYFEPSKNQVKEKLQNLSESFQQQKSVMRFINENPETKIVGKNKQGEILMINNKKLISVNNKGRLI